MFHTVVCDLLNIRYPVLQGAMQGGGGVALVAAVSEAGGLGVLPTFGGTDQKLRTDIAAVRSLTAKPFGVNIMPLGRGITERCAATCIELGIPIVTTEQAHQALLDAGLSRAEADAVTDDYANAQLNALSTSMLAVAFLAVGSFWFTRRLPGRRRQAA